MLDDQEWVIRLALTNGIHFGQPIMSDKIDFD